MAGLFGGAVSSLTAAAAPAAPATAPAPRRAPSAPRAAAAPLSGDLNTLIADAATDLSDYQRLTAEGKLGEAGSKLEALKQKLERLNQLRR